MWKLAKWGWISSQIPLTCLVVPSLRIAHNPSIREENFNFSWYLAKIFEDKVEVLQHQFFSARPEIDLSDLLNSSYPVEITDDKPIIENKIRLALAKMPSGKTLRRSGITSNFLK